MMDRSKVLHALQTISDKLFTNSFAEHEQAQQLFKTIADDPTFVHKARAAQVPYPVPSWDGRLDQAVPIARGLEAYRVVSVDGSQIYPDRHQGASCYLINVGTVALAYGVPGKRVVLQSVPHVFVGDEDAGLNESATELVNCKREEFEFIAGVQASAAMNKQQCDAPLLFLFDGSLIFWHLDAKDPEVKHKYLTSYLTSLQQFYAQKLLMAGYISMPRSRELTNLLRLALCNFGACEAEEEKILDQVLDTTIVQWFLQPFERTTVFKNHAKITAYYPDYIHPYFFYVHTGDEIGRVEIPAWIATDASLVTLVAQMVIDQAIKGRGYPVAIAEAHEQAVVKGPDRDFFYQLIRKFGIEHKQRLRISQKSLKKRGIGI